MDQADIINAIGELDFIGTVDWGTIKIEEIGSETRYGKVWKANQKAPEGW